MWALVSDYIGSLVTIIFSLLFCKIVLNKEININKILMCLFVILISVLLETFYLLDVNVIRSLLSFVLLFLLFKIVYGLDYYKSLLLGVLYITFTAISDIIIILLFVCIFGKRVFYEQLAGTFISNLCVSIVVILLGFLFKKIINRLFKVKLKNKLILMSILVIVCVVCLFYYSFSVVVPTLNAFLGSFCIFVLILALISSFIQAYKNNKLVDEYDNLLSFIKKYETEIDNQRMLRHETKNQLLTIKSKIIDKEKNSEIISYIDEILNDDRKVNHSDYAKLKYLPSNGIKGLFYFKLSLAQDKGIKIGVSISKSIENSFLNDLDSSDFNQIGKILGVYLDNAIEAADKSKDKVIGVEVFQDNDRIIFVISNSYNANQKMIGRTSKGPGRGYGLLLVNNIISNNDKLSSSTEITDDLYIKKLAIKK